MFQLPGHHGPRKNNRMLQDCLPELQTVRDPYRDGVEGPYFTVRRDLKTGRPLKAIE